MAGRLKIPFTTGLLCGVGETRADRLESLRAIAEAHERHGHIQEVILQPFSPGDRQAYRGPDGDEARFDVAEDLPALVSAARKLLPSDVSIQVPPNLAQIDLLQKCLEAGADDVGGLSATDHVNPTYAFPDVQTDLAEAVRHLGRDLRRRAPVHDRFVDWMPERPRRVYDEHWAHLHS